MKRFLCSQCQRVVRVRQLPPVTEGKPFPIGVCRHHGVNGSRARVMSRVQIVAGFGSTRKISATSQKSKSK
jgi:hypothetical protein